MISRVRLMFGDRTSPLRVWPSLHAELRRRHLRASVAAVRVADDVLLARTLGHFKLFLAADDLDITPHLALDGIWEPDVTRVIVDRLQPGDTAVDAGANVGYFTVLMAGLVGRGGRVLSIEPHPAPAALLARSVRANGFDDRVDRHVLPIAEADGEAVALVTPDNASGGAHIAPTDHVHGRPVARTRRLDGLPGARDAVLVKLDTEGAEERIWRGMGAMLAGTRLRYVVVEFSRTVYADPAGFLAEAAAHGFACRRILSHGRLPDVAIEDVLAGPAQQMLLLQR